MKPNTDCVFPGSLQRAQAQIIGLEYTREGSLARDWVKSQHPEKGGRWRAA